MNTQQTRLARITTLNDELRRRGRGGDIFVSSRLHETLTKRELLEVIVALQAFESFNERKKQEREHKCAAFEALGRRFFFNIDYFAASRDCQSPDPAAPELTRRILTLMSADERSSAS